MTSYSNVSIPNGKVNLLELKEWLRREFLTFFEDSSGKKVKIYFVDIFFFKYIILYLKANYLG